MRALQLVVVCLALSVETAVAQTREEALREEREEKAKEVTPNRPTGLQRALSTIEQNALLLTTRDGFHPKIGSLTTGSGFAYGLGYRSRNIFARYGSLEAFGAASIRRYWAVETRARFPELAAGRLELDGFGSLREYPEERFYGFGPDSKKEDESNFSLRTATVGGRAAVKPLPLTSVGGGVDYLETRVGPGQNDDIPTVLERFGGVSAPNLEARTDFVRTSLFAAFDYREPLNARKGGYYRIERSHYSDRTTGSFSFNRTDIELRQFFGFFAGRRVIAMRGLYSTTDGADGGSVPFFYMPWLGGKDTLRGYRDYRFRGPHSLLLQAEYRWEIWSGLDGAFFYDTGKVAMERRDINLKHLESAYGFGFRFNTDNAVIMRFDAAFGSRDGKRLHMTVGGFF